MLGARPFAPVTGSVPVRGVPAVGDAAERGPAVVTERRWLWLLLLLAVLVHAPSLANGFALDDTFVASSTFKNGKANPMVAELQSPAEYFGSPYWRGTDRQDRLYRPLTIASFALVHAAIGRALGAGEALPQHAVNLLLFAWVTLLLWQLLGALGSGSVPRVAATAVFAVHAIHAEAVSPVTGRGELLAAVGGLSFVLCGWKVLQGSTRFRTVIACMATLFCGLASKESALAFAVLAPLVWRSMAHGAGVAVPTWRQTALGTAALAGPPIAVVALLRANALAGLPLDAGPSWVVNPLLEAPFVERLPTAVMLQGLALWKLLWPFSLASDYGAHVFARATSWFDVRVGAALVALAGVAFGTWRRRQLRLCVLGVIAYAVLILPTSNLLLPIGTQFAERLLFAPSLGLSLVVAGLVPLLGPRARRWGAAVLVVWCSAVGVRTFLRAMDWRDDATLVARDVVTQPDSLLLRLNAAVLAGKRGDLDDRLAHLREAVRIAPDYASAWNDLGVLLLSQNDLPGAERALRSGLSARRADPNKDLPVLQTNLAVVLVQRPETAAEALALLQQALPRNAAGITQRLTFLYPQLLAAPGAALLAFLQSGRRHSESAIWSLVEALDLERTGAHAAALQSLARVDPATARAFFVEVAAAASLPAEVREAARRLDAEAASRRSGR